MHYYKRIRELREETGITQRKIGEVLTMPQTQYIRYEQGKIDTPTELLCTLADYYKVSTDYLLGRTDDRKQPPKSKEG